MPRDLQWPSAARLPKAFAARPAPVRVLDARTREIEALFEARLGVHAVLTPSARAGLALIFRAHGIGRSRTVFSPRWVSHCVWDAIGRFANPTTSFEARPDVILAVHKWGTVSRLSRPAKALVIEDSVDTLFTSGESLFPNGGLYELLSLPKIVGSFCGGVVLTRDASAAERLRRLRGEDRIAFAAAPLGGAAGARDARGLAVHQAALKWKAARAARSGRPAFMEWEYLEFENVRLDASSLAHAADCVSRWDECAAVIRGRLDRVRREEPRWAARCDADRGRLPPVLTIPCADEAAAARAGLAVRRFDERRLLDRPSYRPVMVLPLHFGVSDEEFDRLLRGALKARG